MKPIRVQDATEPGYYWWLPAFHGNNASPENWSIVAWHKLNPQRTKSGWFVGPITPPDVEVAKR